MVFMENALETIKSFSGSREKCQKSLVALSFRRLFIRGCFKSAGKDGSKAHNSR